MNTTKTLILATVAALSIGTAFAREVLAGEAAYWAARAAAKHKPVMDDQVPSGSSDITPNESESESGGNHSATWILEHPYYGGGYG